MIANAYLKIIHKTIAALQKKEPLKETGKDNIETLFLKLYKNVLANKYTANIAKSLSEKTFAVELTLNLGTNLDVITFIDEGIPYFQIPTEINEDEKNASFLLSLVCYAYSEAGKRVDSKSKTFQDELKNATLLIFRNVLKNLVDTGVKTGFTPANFDIANYQNTSKLFPSAKIENGNNIYSTKDVSMKILSNKGNTGGFLDEFNDKDWSILNEENHVYNKFEEERLENNKLTEGYVPTLEDRLFVQRIYNSIKKRGTAPSFFFYGPAGTGKSEKGKYFSKMTGIPYTFICCSAMTTESDLRGKPQTLGTTGGLVKFLNKVCNTFWHKNIDIDGIDDSKIKYSLTELVLACKYGWIIEIQEPTLIVNAGTLGFLNCILDNNRTLILPDGEQIKIHPNTTFIFTTNLTYEGCNLLNNSLLSRIDYVRKINLPSIDEQVDRLVSITKYSGNRNDCKKVIQAVSEISNILEQNDISQGISDFRSAIDCVLDYMENENSSWRVSARYTIEDKSCLEEGYEEQIKNKLDSIFGEN